MTDTIRTISDLSEEEISNAIDGSNSLKDVIVRLGFDPSSNNYRLLKNMIDKFGLEAPIYSKGSVANPKYVPNDEVFRENSTYTNRTSIKQRLVLMGWEYCCSQPSCTISDTWLGKPIVLHLDHINGVKNDNRLDNLRFLCPNCHTQTGAFAGRNLKPRPKKVVRCSCGKEKSSPRSTRCVECSNKAKRRITYPPVDDLKSLVEAHGFTGAGKILGVSDNAIRKHLKIWG